MGLARVIKRAQAQEVSGSMIGNNHKDDVPIPSNEIQRTTSFKSFTLDGLTEEAKVAIELLWSRGTLSFLLHEGQRKMLKSFEGKTFAN